jgi:hypothetical protein
MWGASSPHVKLTGDFANVSDAIRIGDWFPFRNFAKNQSPCNFRLLQQYRPLTAATANEIRGSFWGAKQPRPWLDRKEVIDPERHFATTKCRVAKEVFDHLVGARDQRRGEGEAYSYQACALSVGSSRCNEDLMRVQRLLGGSGGGPFIPG